MTLPTALRVLIAPAQEPITLSEAKQFLRVSYDSEDTLINTLIVAAREAAEAYLNCSFITRRYQLDIDHCLNYETRLPRGPVTQIVSVERSHDGETFEAVSLDGFSIGSDRVTLYAPTVSAKIIRITYDAGDALNANEVPAHIRQALLRHVALLFDTRSDNSLIDITPIYAGLKEVRL